jgi:hypothetical protein
MGQLYLLHHINLDNSQDTHKKHKKTLQKIHRIHLKHTVFRTLYCSMCSLSHNGIFTTQSHVIVSWIRYYVVCLPTVLPLPHPSTAYPCILALGLLSAYRQIPTPGVFFPTSPVSVCQQLWYLLTYHLWLNSYTHCKSVSKKRLCNNHEIHP